MSSYYYGFTAQDTAAGAADVTYTHMARPSVSDRSISPFVRSPFLNENLYVSRTLEGAVLPARQSHNAAGYDLTSCETTTILPGDRALISTGLTMMIPPGHYGRIAPRSGLAWKEGISVGAGVIDSDYRGVVAVLLFNLSKKPVELLAGSRVAQLIIEQISTPLVVEMSEEEFRQWTTTRGSGGFGSTGVTSAETKPVPEVGVPDSKMTINISQARRPQFPGVSPVTEDAGDFDKSHSMPKLDNLSDTAPNRPKID